MVAGGWAEGERGVGWSGGEGGLTKFDGEPSRHLQRDEVLDLRKM